MAQDVASRRVDDAILEAIRRGWIDDWSSPTVLQLATQLGMSVSSMHYRLTRLVARGELQCKRLSPRRVLYRAPS